MKNKLTNHRNHSFFRPIEKIQIFTKGQKPCDSCDVLNLRGNLNYNIYIVIYKQPFPLEIKQPFPQEIKV